MSQIATEKKRTCRQCGKVFATINSRKNHERSTTHTKPHMSIAEQMIDNQLSIAMGDGGEDWLTEMDNS